MSDNAIETTENTFNVGATGDKLVVVHGYARLTYGLPPAEVLNLVAWMTVVAGVTDQEIAEARRAVENAS